MADSSTRAPERCVEEDGRRRGRKRRWQGCDTSPRWQVLASAHGAVLRSVPKEPAPAAGLPLGSRPRGTDPTSAGLNATKRLCGECREPPGPGTGTKPEHGCLQTRSRAGGSRDAVQTPRPRSGATQEMCPAPGGPAEGRGCLGAPAGYRGASILLHSPAEVGTLLPYPWWHPDLAGDSPACSRHPSAVGSCSCSNSGSPNFPKAIRGCKVRVSWESSPAFISTRNTPRERRRLLQVWPRGGTGEGQGHEELCCLRNRG